LRQSSLPTPAPPRPRGASMSSIDLPGGIDPIAHNLIRRKANKLATQAGFSRQDRDDLEQELWGRTWHRFRSFDPAKGNLQGFLAMLIKHAATDLWRERLAAKRDYRRLRPLSGQREAGEEKPAGEPSQDVHDGRLGRSPSSPEEQAQLASDMAEVLA